MAAHGENVKAAFGKLLPGFAFGLGRLNLLEDPSGGIPDFADKFSHFDRLARRRNPLGLSLT